MFNFLFRTASSVLGFQGSLHSRTFAKSAPHPPIRIHPGVERAFKERGSGDIKWSITVIVEGGGVQDLRLSVGLEN